LVEALRYKPKGPRFIAGGVTGIFHSFNPFGRNVCGVDQPLIEMNTGNISWGVKVACAVG